MSTVLVNSDHWAALQDGNREQAVYHDPDDGCSGAPDVDDAHIMVRGHADGKKSLSPCGNCYGSDIEEVEEP